MVVETCVRILQVEVKEERGVWNVRIFVGRVYVCRLYKINAGPMSM